MKKIHKIPNARIKETRQFAKRKRGKGLLFLKEKKIEVNDWSKKNDPLWGVKGIERHLRSHIKT